VSDGPEVPMELVKTLLDFVARIAYPLVLALFLVLFRPQLAAMFLVLEKIFKTVQGGVERGDVEIKYGSLTVSAARKLRSDNLESAAKTVQELLSPAAPLALGYIDNFLHGLVVTSDGRFRFGVEESLAQYRTLTILTIYIPRSLRDDEPQAPNLINDEYRDEDIRNVSIESKYGRPFTGFAILRANCLYPVDVPKTLTSIRHVFKFRERQLMVDAHMDATQIDELERKNLDEFARIVEDRSRELQESGCIRVIRDRSALFAPAARRGEAIARGV
jgi:nucleotide-binding STING sensor domain-containing protein